MNIVKENSQNLVNLNESTEKIKQEVKNPINTDLLIIVMKTKSKQFKFDCGVIMGKIDILLDNRFGLNWHYKNTKSFDEFKSNVAEFILSTNNTLTSNDVSNLERQYNKYKLKQTKI
jgi:hypothetical protein